jgi:3-hydroxybutyryl-CoA dehydratase
VTKVRDFDSIEIGQSAERTTAITSDLIAGFADLTGDDNPVHLDDGYAAGTFFGRRVAHGMISASLLAALMGAELPGYGTIYLSQSLEFKAPVYPGDVVTARVSVLEKVAASRKVRLSTTASKADGQVVIDGTAWVMLRTARPSVRK